MTETTSIGTLNLPDAYKFGTIGQPVAGADIRIAEDGEIEMAGPMLMKEYWNNPAATADTLTEDGYLRTGDLGAIDEDGFVTITGRKKDIIITAGGKNLTPANLEGDLRRSRWISQAVMFGDRKPYPVALITLDPEEIIPWAQQRGLSDDVAALADARRRTGDDPGGARRRQLRSTPRSSRSSGSRSSTAGLHAGRRRADAVAEAEAQRRLRPLRRRVRRAVPLAISWAHRPGS